MTAVICLVFHNYPLSFSPFVVYLSYLCILYYLLNNKQMELIDEYLTITDSPAEGFYSEKRSKFLAFAFHVTTEEEVKNIVAEHRKKYYDARHVCWAYTLGADHSQFRANDDGEPSSTAGKPILGQITKNDLTDILIIVVRYYGGVNLGTSGLIVAYRTAAAEAIAAAEIVKLYKEEEVVYDFPYIMMTDVMKIIKEMSPRIVGQTYDNTCEIRLSIRASEAPILKEKLEKLSFKDD